MRNAINATMIIVDAGYIPVLACSLRVLVMFIMPSVPSLNLLAVVCVDDVFDAIGLVTTDNVPLVENLVRGFG